MISVAFSNVTTIDPAGFYQHTFGGDTAPGCNLIAAFPTLVCDSFVTLGAECDADGSSTDPDFDSTGFNNSGTVDGGWFNSSPTNGQGAPDSNGRVMIARFSNKQNKVTSGDVCVFAKLAGSEQITEFLLQPFDCSVPGGGLPPGGGTTICFVDDDGAIENDCADWDNACSELQIALDPKKIPRCGEIWVAAGTYKPDFDVAMEIHTGDRNATFQLINGVAIYGGFDGLETELDERDPETNETILNGDIDGDDTPVECTQDSPECNSHGRKCIDGFCIIPDNNDENSYHVVTGSNTDSTAVLDGFTVKGGKADDTAAQPRGGGMLNEGGSPSVRNCTFIGNYSDHLGAGMVNLEGSSPAVVNCTFTGNSGLTGGGMGNRGLDDEFGNPQHSRPLVTDCMFSGNRASSWGGGMDNHGGSDPTVTNCTFENNAAGGSSGGMHFSQASAATLNNCVFRQNSAIHGGAILHAGDSLTVTNCLFSGNFTVSSAFSDDGGAINHKLGILIATNCTFSGNAAVGDGGGLHVAAEVVPGNTTLNNCIFWDNSDSGPQDESAQIHVDGPIPTVTFTDVQGLVTDGQFDSGLNVGNIGLDPMFIDADGVDDIFGTPDDNLHLTAVVDPAAGSPCIDAADNTVTGLIGITEDLDGYERFLNDPETAGTGVAFPQGDPDIIVDMGAYEFQACQDCPGDTTGDGEVGAADLAQLLAAWGACDESCLLADGCPCQSDFNGDCAIGAFDLASLLAAWGPCP